MATFSLDHKKHAEYITCADYHLAISSGIKQQMINRGVAESTINVIFNPVETKDSVIPAPEEGETATFIYVGRMKFEGQKELKTCLMAYHKRKVTGNSMYWVMAPISKNARLMVEN